MLDRKKTWFLAPGDDIPAEAVRLGTMLVESRDLRRPLDVGVMSLNAPSMANARNNNIGISSHPEAQVWTVDKQLFKDDINHNRHTKLGLWTEFLSVLGVGADASVGFDRSKVAGISAETLSTQWFTPSKKFILASLASDTMASLLEDCGHSMTLYMVTGLRIAQGIHWRAERGRSHEIEAKIAVDNILTGAPIKLGPEVEISRGTNQIRSWENDRPLVYAYQLEKIRVNRKGLKSEAYTKGDLFDANTQAEGVDLDIEQEGAVSEGEFPLVQEDDEFGEQSESINLVRA